MLDFAKLLLEKECIQVIENNPPSEKLSREFVIPALMQLADHIVEAISLAKLKEPHVYRYTIQIHAQKQEEIKS